MSNGLLENILIHKRVEIEERKKRIPPISLVHELNKVSVNQKPCFSNVLRRSSGERLKLVAEIKKTSPSKGPLRETMNPVEIALIYEKSGASAVSVLTDEKFFQGSFSYLKNVSDAISIPTLCKDFILDPYQLMEARISGAGAVLLIVAALQKNELRHLLEEARSMGLEIVVEVHREGEIEIALECGARIMGVNNRDLESFHVDLGVSEKLIQKIPKGVIRLAESGISTVADMKRLSECGFDAVLIGETFMKVQDIQNKVAELLSYER